MPPIIVNDYTVSQSHTNINIKIHWPAPITSKSADICANDVYVKIHAGVFMFHLDLMYPIIEENASCTIKNDEHLILLCLPKQTPGVWDTIQFEPVSNGEHTAEQLLNIRRDDARTRHAAKLKEMRKKKECDHWDQSRYMVRQQMDVEQNEREYVNQLKQNEKQIAMKSLNEWTDSTPATGTAFLANDESSDEDDTDIQALRLKYRQIASGVNISTCDPDHLVPPVRGSGHIEFQFTERIFVSAARHKQDAKWMAQMEESRRSQVPGAENEQVIKLLEKAMKFQAQGQYMLAIDAYSALITMSPANHKIYIGRCECYARLKYMDQAAKDAHRALQLIMEMEQKHEIQGVYEQVKAQLKMHIDAANEPTQPQDNTCMNGLMPSDAA